MVLADEPTGNLDTKGGEIVIDLLASLHRDLEITLVLVTHDQWVAERADRAAPTQVLQACFGSIH